MKKYLTGKINSKKFPQIFCPPPHTNLKFLSVLSLPPPIKTSLLPTLKNYSSSFLSLHRHCNNRWVNSSSSQDAQRGDETIHYISHPTMVFKSMNWKRIFFINCYFKTLPQPIKYERTFFFGCQIWWAAEKFLWAESRNFRNAPP